MAKVILTEGENFTVSAGNTVELYGTNGVETITIEPGATVEIKGGIAGDTLKLAGNAANYQIFSDGTTVTFTDTVTGKTIIVPAGPVAGTVTFDDGDRDLVIDTNAGVIKLGDDVVSDEEANPTTPSNSEPNTPDAGGDTGTGALTITVADAQAVEGDETIDFLVTLSAAQDEDVTLDYQTVKNTAFASSDYTHVNGTLTIPAGETSATIQVQVLDNDVFDGTATNQDGVETFTLELSNPSQGTLASTSVTGTISDDETNDIPVNTLPTEEVSIVLTNKQALEGIQVADANNNNLTVVLEAENGLLEIADADNGNASLQSQIGKTLTLTGTKSDLNDALATLKYVSDRTKPGKDTISITTTDVLGGEDVDTLTINVENGFIFTTGTDTFTGTSGGTSANEIFIAESGTTTDDITTLSAVDSADGGEGTDILVVDVNHSDTGEFELGSGADISNIEVLKINYHDTTVDLNVSQDLKTDLTINNSYFNHDIKRIEYQDLDATANNLKLSELKDDTEVILHSSARVLIAELASDADAFSVDFVNGVSVRNFAMGSTGEVKTLTLNSLGEQTNKINILGSFNGSGYAQEAEINITGSADFIIETIGRGTLDTSEKNIVLFDGSDATGDLTINASEQAGTGALTIKGGAGEDTLTAKDSGSTLEGGAGDDTLNGGAGNDILVGGAGKDTISVTQGDTVKFAAGDTGATTETRDLVKGVVEGVKFDLSGYSTSFDDLFGLASGDSLAYAASDDSQREVYIDQAKQAIVIEMDAAGTTTEEIFVGTAVNAMVTYNGAGELEFGAVPITAKVEGASIIVEGQPTKVDQHFIVDLGTTVPQLGNDKDGAAFEAYSSGNGIGSGDWIDATDTLNPIQGALTSKYNINASAVSVGEEEAGGILRGNDQSNLLVGTQGKDVFIATAGTDTLVLGEANGKALAANASAKEGWGSDVVVIDLAEMGSGTTTIVGFKLGSGEGADVLDLSAGNTGSGYEVDDLTSNMSIAITKSDSAYQNTFLSAEFLDVTIQFNEGATIIFEDLINLHTIDDKEKTFVETVMAQTDGLATDDQEAKLIGIFDDGNILGLAVD